MSRSDWFPECACVHSDRYMCIAWRTDRSYEEVTDASDECQCYCHSDVEEEDAELLDAIDSAWQVSEDERQRVHTLFLQKLEAKYPGHPWTK